MRDEIAQRRDIAPGRILPDSAIIEAAADDPKTLDDLVALPIFGGKRQRRSASTWLAALKVARETPVPQMKPSIPTARPPPARWARRRPEAAERLDAARSALRELSEQVSVPTENLVTPELIRRLCWDWEGADDVASAIDEFLAVGQARDWQRELTVPVLTTVLQAPPKRAATSPAAR